MNQQNLEQQMRDTLTRMVSQYTPNPEYIQETDSLIEDFCKLYHWFLRGRPLTGLLLRMEVAPGREEAVEVADRLNSSQAFIEEVEDCLFTLESIGVMFGPEPIPEWQLPERVEPGRQAYKRYDNAIPWSKLAHKEQESWVRLMALVEFAGHIGPDQHTTLKRTRI